LLAIEHLAFVVVSVSNVVLSAPFLVTAHPSSADETDIAAN